MELKATKVLNGMWSAQTRFILSVGSTRSSKTYSVYQWILLYCKENQGSGKWISMVRRSFPSLKRSLLREFIQFLEELGLYSEKRHNKSSQIIEIYGNFIEFFSLDDFEKVKGSKRDVCYLNEITEIDYEPANQIFLRTSEKIIMDMNPSDSNHWVWSYKGRPDVTYIHSTYKDNPFLSPDIVKQIESYKDLDENYWRIYGLGLPGFSEATVFQKWSEYSLEPPHYEDVSWGLDYGYNHASALVKCYHSESDLYFEEVIYEKHLTVEDLVTKISDLGITGQIFVDSARPDLIQSLHRSGMGAVRANKKVKEGIDYLKSKRIHINENSYNLKSEIKNYKWKTSGDMILDEPVKINDDAVDAMRYSAFTNNITNVNIKDIFFKL